MLARRDGTEMTIVKLDRGSTSLYVRDEHGRIVAHVSVAGPTLWMIVGRRTYAFEMHHYFGPCAVNKRTGDPTTRDHGKAFWDAYERWTQGGRLIDASTSPPTCVVPDVI